jgi:phenolic acid decarboxylase
MTTKDRFQDQPWYVKLWRFRWYLKIPFDTITYRFKSRFTDGEWKKAYSLAIGDAQYKMKWFYTLDEAREKLSKKRKK